MKKGKLKVIEKELEKRMDIVASWKWEAEDWDTEELGKDCGPPCMYYEICRPLSKVFKKNGHPFRCPLHFKV